MVEVHRVQGVVIGCGAVGLACARALSQVGCELLILESSPHIGSGTSSRNSEVIHSGIYYPHGSQKWKMCVRGKDLLYEYLNERQIAYKRCGKLVVSTSADDDHKLKGLLENAELNGVEGVRLLSSREVTELEPCVHATSGLLSETTGVFDSHTYMEFLRQDVEESGSACVLNCAVEGIERTPDGRRGGRSRFVTQTSQGVIESDFVVNACGLSAPFVASKVRGYPTDRVPKAYFAKGNYFKLQVSKPPFSHLIYPLPPPGGLGVHSTIDVSGAVKFGPDVHWLRERTGDGGGDGSSSYSAGDVRNDDLYEFTHGPPEGSTVYRVDESLRATFVQEIARYYPAIIHTLTEDLVPDYAGIRPKLVGPSGWPRGARDAFERDLSDFVVEGPGEHGVEGLVHLYGIESPGLTSSMAIAEIVRGLVV